MRAAYFLGLSGRRGMSLKFVAPTANNFPQHVCVGNFGLQSIGFLLCFSDKKNSIYTYMYKNKTSNSNLTGKCVSR